MKYFILIVIYTLLPIHAAAEVATPKLTNTYKLPNMVDVCNSARNSRELGECLNIEYEKAEKHLNDIQRDIKNEGFRKVNDAWISFVNTSCEYDASIYGGSTNFAHCKLSYTLSRIRLIEKYNYCLSTNYCGQPVSLHLFVSPINYGD